jgi:hypothetical protein
MKRAPQGIGFDRFDESRVRSSARTSMDTLGSFDDKDSLVIN